MAARLIAHGSASARRSVNLANFPCCRAVKIEGETIPDPNPRPDRRTPGLCRHRADDSPRSPHPCGAGAALSGRLLIPLALRILILRSRTLARMSRSASIRCSS